ncbi:MAG: hypothetical protein WD016_00425 [Balneolaceae bacterium]
MDKRKTNTVPSKGERLNWTPKDKAGNVYLKSLDIKAEEVPSEKIQRAKRFVNGDARLVVA